MSEGRNVTVEDFEAWANDHKGAVGLHLRQRLLPIEGKEGVLFPPTYAEVGYNIDSLADGTKVATIDSVGAQANRMEPIFKAGAPHVSDPELSALVPQVSIEVGGGTSVSILDAGHRLGDALVRSSTVGGKAREAFEAYLKSGDAKPLAKLGPTSLVFGVWDSRDTQAKLPRIVQSVIRAWDVSPLTRRAQYAPPVDYAALEVFSEEDKKKAEGDEKNPLAKRGFVHVPAEAPGGVVVHGEIIRDVTVNLLALRRLEAKEQGNLLRRYILGLSLVAATEPLDGFLRQGCLLTPHPEAPAEWVAVARDGQRTKVLLTSESVRAFARKAASEFGVEKSITARFDKSLAVEDLKEDEGKAKKTKKQAKA